jgi:hypothetical protein
VCPIGDREQFRNIAHVCCESSTSGAAGCSAGSPFTCTRACELLEPLWTDCGTLGKVLRDMHAADENAIDREVRLEHTVVLGACPDVCVSSSYVSNGEYDAAAGSTQLQHDICAFRHFDHVWTDVMAS